MLLREVVLSSGVVDAGGACLEPFERKVFRLFCLLFRRQGSTVLKTPEELFSRVFYLHYAGGDALSTECFSFDDSRGKTSKSVFRFTPDLSSNGVCVNSGVRFIQGSCFTQTPGATLERSPMALL
jgi:hypothetical protein